MSILVKRKKKEREDSFWVDPKDPEFLMLYDENLQKFAHLKWFLLGTINGCLLTYAVPSRFPRLFRIFPGFVSTYGGFAYWYSTSRKMAKETRQDEMRQAQRVKIKRDIARARRRELRKKGLKPGYIHPPTDFGLHQT